MNQLRTNTKKIDGLRGVIGDPSDDEESVKSTPNSTPSSSMRIIGLYSSRGSNFRMTPDCLSDTKVTAQLCQIYLRQVDPIIKVLHRPSLSKFMLDGQGYLSYEFDHASTTCLSAAVCYSALASMTEEQCQDIFGTGKSAIIVEYRAACEVALEESELLVSTDITVLQAFVLYLVARRTEDSSRAVWTMIAVAVRIAKALSIHVHRPGSFFNQQMRQRLWYTICVLDLQSSFEQVSEPLIELDMESLPLPRNINDSEFDVDTPGEVHGRDGLTDMTFALVTYNAQLSGRLLNFYGKEADSFNWEERKKHISHFEQNVLNLLKFCDPESSVYAWFTFHGAQSLVAAISLSALRPLHNSGNKPKPRAQLFADLLKVALKVLEKINLIRTDPRGEGFRWYVIVQWHALAIAITECYACTDVEMLQTAWPVVEAAFTYHKTVIGSHRQETLKKPLETLINQTRMKINPLLQKQRSFQESSEPDIGSLGLDSPNDHSYITSPTVSTRVMESPHPIGQPLSQQHPQQPIPPFDFNFGRVNPLLSLDNSNITTTSIQPWFTTQIPFSQDVEMNNISEVNDGVAGNDASWRMWDEFVSGLPFDDFAQDII